MTAQIQISGGGPPVVGSIEVPAATLCTFSNLNNTGVQGWFWQLLDKPAGSASLLSASTGSSVTLTPDIPGTYLVRLTTYADALLTLVDGQDQQCVGVRYVPPFTWRLPAARETTQYDADRGWKAEVNAILDEIRTGLISAGGGGDLQAAYALGNLISTTPATPVDVIGTLLGQTELLRLIQNDATTTSPPLRIEGAVQGVAPNRWARLAGLFAGGLTAGALLFASERTPEALITAPPGSLCFVRYSAANPFDGLWIKSTGVGNTGWTQAGAGSGSATVVIPIEAGQTIAVGDAVSAAPTAGRCRRANANGGAPPLLGNFLGVASIGGTGPADSATILTCGPVGTGAGLTANAPVFLDVVTPGLVTSTPPAGAGNLALRIGWAWSATDYVLHVGEGTLLT